MEDWETFLRKLIHPPIAEIHLERGREIREILESLSKYPFDRIKKFKNIRENEDLARDEMRGAAQRYIYGHFVDSIIWSCFSVEFGLLVRLDELLPDIEKKRVPKPFTLGKIINWAYAFSILDDASKKAAKEILKLRNVHIHGSNFISALILSYKGNLEFLEGVGVSVEIIEQGLGLFSEIFPEEAMRPFLRHYEPSDIAEALKAIQSLSSFEWCADKRRIGSVKRELDKMITNIVSNLLQGDSEKLRELQEDYFLKVRALRSLRYAHIVLKKIEIL